MPTKPIIKYQGMVEVPNVLSPTAIVRKRVGSEFVNWADVTELTNFIDTLYVPPTSDTYMYIICGCGEEYTYTLKTDLH